MSGERVSDWFALPSSPDPPPYSKKLTMLLALSRKVTTPPVLVSDRPLLAATLNTCAPPKTGSLGLGLPPPKTMIAARAGKIVPLANVSRRVSVVVLELRVKN